MNPIWLHISSGQGPGECRLAIFHLLKKLEAEAEARGIALTVLEAVPDRERDGFSSVLLSVKGEDARAFANELNGSILWVCRSPLRPHHKRKNWYIGVSVLTVPEQHTLDDSKIECETYLASGPGGQHVNTTASAVRLRYPPLNLTVTASQERSQVRNRQLALAKLYKAVEQKNQGVQDDAEQELWMHHNTLERGNPRRVYRGETFKRDRRGN